MSYFIRIDDQETGPHSLEELIALWEEGRIAEATLCRDEDSEEWTPVGGWLAAEIRERDRAAAFTSKAVAQWESARKNFPSDGGERVLIALGAFALTPLIGMLFAWYYHSRGDGQRARLWFVWSLVWAVIPGVIWLALTRLTPR